MPEPMSVAPPIKAAAGTLKGAVKADANPPTKATPPLATFSPVFSSNQYHHLTHLGYRLHEARLCIVVCIVQDVYPRLVV